ncbi:sortase [Patescibacteria group bacterium]
MWISKVFTTITILLLLAVVIVFSPFLIQELSYYFKKANPKDYRLVENYQMEPEEIRQETLELAPPNLVTPVSYDFSLVVPKVDINSRVTKFVDLYDRDEFHLVLTKGVAHARGSGLPVDSEPVFIFAHPLEGYLDFIFVNNQFYMLRKLEVGDLIYVFYYKKQYIYEVEEKRIVDPEEVKEEIDNLQGKKLVIMTYYPPGTMMSRMLIIGQLQSDYRYN